MGHLFTDQYSTLKAKTLAKAICIKEWQKEGLVRWNCVH
jgi:hypothetical protein